VKFLAWQGCSEYTVILNSYLVQPLPINAIKPIAGRHPSKHPIWRADELAASQGQTVPTGDATLNAQLPGGGWPVGALVEVLQAHTGHNDWRLLLPALVKTEGVLVLVGAPHAPFAPGLAGQGLDPARLLCVNTPTPAARMWAAEQALRCQDVAAVLAWLPQARADSLRRLQISAAEHRKLLFVMRPARAQHESSPAVLRVITSTALEGDALLVHILKRRGPPLEQALTLVARPVRLGTLLALGKNARGAGKEGKAGEAALPVAELLDFPHPPPEHSHALDRAAA
jgi:protein ImuA